MSEDLAMKGPLTLYETKQKPHMYSTHEILHVTSLEQPEITAVDLIGSFGLKRIKKDYYGILYRKSANIRLLGLSP